MPHREMLTDNRLKALKPAEKGKRKRIWDAIQPHLAIRVTDKGAKTFIVVKRIAGAKQPGVKAKAIWVMENPEMVDLGVGGGLHAHIAVGGWEFTGVRYR